MKLFVRNLSYDLTDEELLEFFSEAGEVESANIVKDRFTGKSKGYGFVTMTNEKGGKAAIESLNGKDLHGRSIAIDKARDRERR